MDSFSLMVDNVAQSRGLQRPKSESFIWPFLSRRRLSGLMSLDKDSGKIPSVATHKIIQDTSIKNGLCLLKFSSQTMIQYKPVDIVMLVNRFYGQDTLCYIKFCNLFS